MGIMMGFVVHVEDRRCQCKHGLCISVSEIFFNNEEEQNNGRQRGKEA
jgi:hypothetical protein